MQAAISSYSTVNGVPSNPVYVTLFIAYSPSPLGYFSRSWLNFPSCLVGVGNISSTSNDSPSSTSAGIEATRLGSPADCLGDCRSRGPHARPFSVHVFRASLLRDHAAVPFHFCALMDVLACRTEGYPCWLITLSGPGRHSACRLYFFNLHRQEMPLGRWLVLCGVRRGLAPQAWPPQP